MSENPTSTIGLDNCFLVVDDHDRALAFYRDILGFAVTNDVAYEAMRWVTVRPPATDVNIVLVGTNVNPNASAEDAALLSGLLAKGALNGLIFRCADVDAVFAQVAASGAEVLAEPADQFYGVRDCAFRDPAGNMLRFNQALAG